MDLKGARSIEKRAKHILAIAKEIFRAPANDYAWAAGKCVLDRQFGNVGDPARIKDLQPIRWRKGPFVCSSEKRLEDAIDRGIIFPFAMLDRLR